MADEIKFEASGFSSLKAQIREAKLEYEALLQNVNATPAAIQEAAAKVAELKDQFDDANDAVNAMTGAGKIQAFTKGLGAVAGGFTAIQGAISLAGGDAKDFEKTMKKLQGAMALSQGLSQLEDLGNAFKNMKTVAVNAFNAIKGAIGATGIGLLVVALGTIYAYWDDIKAAMSGVSAEQDEINAKTQANLTAEQEKLDSLNAQDNILKAQGLSEKEIALLKMKQTDETIKAAEANLQNQKATLKAQEEAAKRNKEILQNLIRLATIPITALLAGLDEVGKFFGKDWNLEESFSGGLAKLVFDPEEVKTEGEAAIKEAEKGLLALKNQRAGYQIQITGIDAKAAADAKAEADKVQKEKEADEEKARKDKEKADKEAEDKEKQRLKDLADFKKNQAEALALTEEQQRALELQKLKEHYDELIAEAERLGQDTLALKTAQGEALKLKQKEFDKEDKERADKKTEEDLAAQQAYRQRLNDLVIQGATSLIGSLKELNSMYDKDNEAAAKKAFEREKALQIAMTIIETYSAAQKVFANAAANPKSVLFPAAPYIEAGIAIVSGLARVAVISKQQFNSPSSGSSSTKGSDSKSSPTPSTYAEGGLLTGRSHDLGGIRTTMGELEGGEFVMNRRSTANFLPLLEALNAQGNIPGPGIAQSQQQIIKTYVVASDMSSQQEADAKLSALARL